MSKIVRWVASATLGLLVGSLLLTSAAQAQDKTPEPEWSCELVDQLDVATEQRDGYDRDLFGDYDRDALLAESLDEHGDYYSVWDDTHYADASDVDVDHTVALAEAWDSGAHSWDEATRDQFAGDPANLTLLTLSVNRGPKSDGDFVEWVPSVSELLDEYLLAYVNVKATYNLSVDETEREELLDAAIELGLCDYDESPAPSTGGPDDAADLPVTGSSLPVIIGIGAGLLGVGVGLFFLARRRRGRYHFTA